MLDVRLPIGLLFLAVGLLLAVYGYMFPPVEQMTLFKSAVPINLNVLWGILMTLFGLAMFSVARLDAVLALEKELKDEAGKKEAAAGAAASENSD